MCGLARRVISKWSGNSCVTLASVTAPRFTEYATYNSFNKSALAPTDFLHLAYPRKNRWCETRTPEISMKKLRRRVPPFNFYLYRSQSPFSLHSYDYGCLEHLFISCRCFNIQRKRFLGAPLRSMGLHFSFPAVLYLLRLRWDLVTGAFVRPHAIFFAQNKNIQC